MKNILLFASVTACFLSCKEPSYFLSPLNSTTQYYHTIPVRADSIRSASYVNAAITLGATNESGRDNIYSFNGNFSRSHNLGLVQVYYGVGATIGDYVIQKVSNTDITIPPTDNFFGAVGFNGGMNLVVPFDNRGSEWRIIGIETSLQNEFGEYLQFRKSLKDSTVSLAEGNNWTTTLGWYSEFVVKTKNGNEVGDKISMGGSFENRANYYGYATHANPVYVFNTFHYTRNNVTGFAQLNIGMYAASLQVGVNCRIGKRMKRQTTFD